MKKNVLLTGASGFVGANLTYRLLKDGHNVHLLVRNGYKTWRIKHVLQHVATHEVDLLDEAELFKSVKKIKPDWVFHLAAYGAYASQSDIIQMSLTNYIATANLVNACLRTDIEAFINTGSSSEYGFKDHAPDEEEWIEPNSNYAITKAAATHYCRFIAQTHHINLATVRLYSVFGPYEEPTRLIPRLIVEGLEGRFPPLVNPDIARDYVYTDDIVNAYIMLAEKNHSICGKVYNLGSGVQTRLSQVVDLVHQHLPVKQQPEWGSMPNRKWDTSVWVANNHRAIQEIGWRPLVDFSAGFKKTIDWLLANTEMLQFYKTCHVPPQ